MQARLYSPELAKEIAADLLEIGAIKLQPENPFTWASGWQSPIYCDNRLSLSFPMVRTKIKDAFCEIIKNEFPETQGIVGVATAGLPQGAIIADQLELPFLYVRSKSKSHGLENQIEGHLPKGQKVVVVEDLVSTGGSSIKAVEAIRAAGGEVLGMISIFTYGFEQAEKNLEASNLKLVHLSDYSTLIDNALNDGSIKQEQKELLDNWRRSPETWSI